MALLLHSGESGFAIVIAVSLGLIMLMVGLTMMLRSQNDQTIASTQKQTEETVAIAEKGVAYYQSFFNSSGLYRRLAQFPDCRSRSIDDDPGTDCTDRNPDPATTTVNAAEWSWSNARHITGFSRACSADFTALTDVYASTDWKDANNPSSATLGPKQFRLVKYEYIRNTSATNIGGLGRLTIEGRITQGSNSNSNKSITRLQVDIPVGDGDMYSMPVPGVWVGSRTDADGTGSSNIDGDVLVNRCFNAANTTDATNFATMQNNIIAPHTARVSDIAMPAIPSDITDIEERVISTPAENPPRLTPSDNPFDDEFDQPGYIDLGTINRDITLPDNTEDFSDSSNPKVADGRFRMDLVGKEDVHVYKIDGFGNGTTTVRIRPGAKVAFLLRGNIVNNVSIICDSSRPNLSTDTIPSNPYDSPGTSCNPTDIMIYGMEPTGQICINGNRKIEGFVFAPGYTVGVAGGGNASPGNFVGAVWANQWRGDGGDCPTGGTGSPTTHVVQVGTWDDYPSFVGSEILRQYPPSLNAAAKWEKRPVPVN
ncbi:MAG: hypothetical protein EAZ76_05095 [Nostocales cyanobacterium]|nr:MAG: hypothetical protein EAZ87_16790 [Nostocales cyanobacterium]TAF18315.1 MAG: hypothetical protein EAZ76_05095 [Nostocales cyanobacterium]